MIAVIHQPYFLPWLGYFSKICFADVFVVMDDADFRKRHYYDRTKIINMHGEVKWIGLPVGQNFKIKCKDVLVEDKSFVAKLVKTISFSYAKAHDFNLEMTNIEQTLNNCIISGSNLAAINIDIIMNILDQLSIARPVIFYSSSFITPSDPTERIITLCQAVSANKILIGSGSSINIHNWQKVKDSGIDVLIQDYMKAHPVYQQSRRQFQSFQPGLSVIDALLNTGSHQTRKFIIDPVFTPKNFDPLN